MVVEGEEVLEVHEFFKSLADDRWGDLFDEVEPGVVGSVGGFSAERDVGVVEHQKVEGGAAFLQSERGTDQKEL